VSVRVGLWSLLALLVAAPAAADDLTCTWADVDLVGGTTASVTAATLTRPYMEARFGAGAFYALQGCEQRVGLLFIGAGELDVRDPGPQRGPQLHHRSDDLPGTVLFEAAVLWASDGAVEDLLAQTDGFVDGGVPVRARAMLAARNDGFLPDRPRSWRPPGEVLWAPEPARGGVLAEFKTAGVRWTGHGSLEAVSPWLSYLWAPTGPLGDPMEPGLWFRRATGSTLQQLLSGFPSESDVAASNTPFALATPSHPWDLLQADVGVAVSGPVGLDQVLETIIGDAHLELRAGEDAGRWVLLDLADGMARRYDEQFAPFDVLGVVEPGDPATPLPWARVGDRLWVQLQQDVAPGSVTTLRVRWTGRVLEKQGQTGITALGATAWYPRPPGRDRHKVTTTVAVPPHWEVVATGHRIGEELDGNVKLVTSRANHPVPHAGVLIADVRSEVLRSDVDGVPLIRLHRSPEYPAINAKVGPELLRHMEALVGILGPYPWTELEVIERGASAGGRWDIPGVVAVGHWDSPPAQLVTTRVGNDVALGALVRQWLEHELGAQSYHDAWLIEGLVTWARCLALDAADAGGRCYGDLQGARRAWLDRLDGDAAAGPRALDLKAGAIWLDSLSGAWSSNRYGRSTLVLHQLRLLIGDAAVRAALPRLLVAYGGQSLSLASFLVQVQALSGTDLRPFVYGWVFNTPTLPVARLDYRLEESDAGWTLVATGIVDDGRDTDPALPLPTPILLSFTVGKEAHVRRIVLSEQPTTVRIEGIPDKPKDVRLDPAGIFPGKTKATRVKD